jgi:protein SCO1/2
VPLELGFTSAQGVPVRLDELVTGDQPVLLVLAYARCEMVCSVVLQGAAQAIAGMSLEPGRDFLPVVVSIDPRERPDEAARKQAALLARIGRPGEPWRWPYLVGSEASVAALAGALGFRFAWDETTRQYAHPAVIFTLTADGRVARYLHGVGWAPDVLTAALGASPARTSLAEDILRCFRFESGASRFGPRLERYFRAGAILVLAVLVSLVGGLVVWERRRSA